MLDKKLSEVIFEYLEITAKAAGFGEPQSIYEIIGAVIGAFLSLLGIIFIILIIYAGFTWMTAGGNEQKVLRAKLTLTRSIVGFIIIMSAYAITAFVFAAVSG
jgi:ABC-type multidrug transport system permease subunit